VVVVVVAVAAIAAPNFVIAADQLANDTRIQQTISKAFMPEENNDNSMTDNIDKMSSAMERFHHELDDVIQAFRVLKNEVN
jgi:hypothetical protein